MRDQGSFSLSYKRRQVYEDRGKTSGRHEGSNFRGKEGRLGLGQAVEGGGLKLSVRLLQAAGKQQSQEEKGVDVNQEPDHIQTQSSLSGDDRKPPLALTQVSCGQPRKC